MAVERLSAVDQRMLPNGVREVILIPWDYDAGCAPTPWARSARWLERGMHGIYNARLRASSHWVKGVPTLDVMVPYGVPYTGKKPANAPEPSTVAETTLSIDELFSVIPYLPDPDLLKTDPEAAAEPMLNWARTNPGLSSRQPASSLVRDAVYAASTERMKRVKPDVAGTWKFSAEIPEETPRVFYGRTQDRPTSTWDPSEGDRNAAPVPLKVWEIRPIEGIYLLTGVDVALEKLPSKCGNAGAHAYLAQRISTVPPSDQSFRAEGDIDFWLAARALRDDPIFKNLRTIVAKSPEELAALKAQQNVKVFFRNDADGVLRAQQSFMLNDGRLLTIKAERISLEVATCPW